MPGPSSNDNGLQKGEQFFKKRAKNINTDDLPLPKLPPWLVINFFDDIFAPLPLNFFSYFCLLTNIFGPNEKNCLIIDLCF
jgi:hypothetical protein